MRFLIFALALQALAASYPLIAVKNTGKGYAIWLVEKEADLTRGSFVVVPNTMVSGTEGYRISPIPLGFSKTYRFDIDSFTVKEGAVTSDVQAEHQKQFALGNDKLVDIRVTVKDGKTRVALEIL